MIATVAQRAFFLFLFLIISLVLLFSQSCGDTSKSAYLIGRGPRNYDLRTAPLVKQETAVLPPKSTTELVRKTGALLAVPYHMIPFACQIYKTTNLFPPRNMSIWVIITIPGIKNFLLSFFFIFFSGDSYAFIFL